MHGCWLLASFRQDKLIASDLLPEHHFDSRQASEYGQAHALIEDMKAGLVLADKGYDSDSFVTSVGFMGHLSDSTK